MYCYEKGVRKIENFGNHKVTKDKRHLLFLHGYLADKNSFAYQLQFFSQYFNVHALDLKGFGENKGMEYPYSLSDYAREVKEYIDNNQLEKPCVIAHSFGGRIAIKLSSTYKNLFSKMVLTGCAGLKPRRGIKYIAKKLTFNFLKLFVKKEKLSSFYSKDYLSLDGTMKESFVKIIGERLDGLLQDIQTPTLIVNGDKDRETPLYMAKKLNKGIKNSKLVVIKNTGHFCFIDSPLKFNTEVREFLLSKE